MQRNEKLLELLESLREGQFTGFIQINYSQGGITRIEKHEEILKSLRPPKALTPRGR